MRDTPISQLQSSILMASLSLIPNNVLRYTLLAIIICTAVPCAIHLQRPSTRLHHLGAKIQHAEEIVQQARSYCPWDVQARLAQQLVRLLAVKHTASVLHCRLLETTKFTVKKYRLFTGDIATCKMKVKSICAAVEFMMEEENLRKYTEDITETESMLASFQTPGVVHGPSGHTVNQQSSRLDRPYPCYPNAY
ncbi:hypothetical protein B0H11DRAFT_2251966 [Mycena galericulata]|nr:hypothetical protein B0H11DRAFT_2251966 [Mycena galericulata]